MNESEAYAGRQRPFRLERGDWNLELLNLVVQRYPGETPILYNLTVFEPGTNREEFRSTVLHLSQAHEAVVLWNQQVPVIIHDVDDVNEAVSGYLQSEDAWRQGRFSLSAAIGWRATAHQLFVAAEVLYQAANEASEEQTRQLIAEFKTNPKDSGSGVLSPQEARLVFVAGTVRQALMLLGFAIENAAKGILAVEKTGAELSAKDGKLRIDSSLRNHDLVKLVQDCGQSITDEEEQALRALSESVIWRGRYPVPIDHTVFQQHTERPANETTYSVGQALLEKLLSGPAN